MYTALYQELMLNDVHEGCQSCRGVGDGWHSLVGESAVLLHRGLADRVAISRFGACAEVRVVIVADVSAQTVYGQHVATVAVAADHQVSHV